MQRGNSTVSDGRVRDVKASEVEFLMLVCDKNANDGLDGGEIVFAVMVWEVG